jgi:gas vesicle structural protein
MALERESASGSLIEVLDRVLDKGIIIDASVRVAIAGIDMIGVDARVFVASFETYLRHADAIAGTDLAARPQLVPPGIRAEPTAPPKAPPLELTTLPEAPPLEYRSPDANPSDAATRPPPDAAPPTTEPTD